jgi:predicted nucleic acid-binding protein
MRLLVDTSAYSAFMRGHGEIKAALQEADEIFVNSIVLGEGRIHKRPAAAQERR